MTLNECYTRCRDNLVTPDPMISSFVMDSLPFSHIHSKAGGEGVRMEGVAAAVFEIEVDARCSVGRVV